jgi:hypothetical protein
MTDCFGDDLLRRHRVLQQVADDQPHRHRIVIRVPTIVVGDQRQRRVTDLGLPRELRFLKIRHANDIHPPGAIEP